MNDALDNTLDSFLSRWNDPDPRLLVHTSGSTGQPKALWVEKERMRASARMTCSFLGLQPGDTALLCLPLQYIAGIMMVVRSLEWGLTLQTASPRHPETGSEPPVFAAMVPLQVARLLQRPSSREWVRGIRHLLIGGGAIDASLEQELRSFPGAVWSTYGMTETLSHIALRRISASAGDGGPCEVSPWYTPLPGVRLHQNAEGCLVIDAPRVSAETLVTHDMAELLPDGRFRILGRLDNVICTGGVKVQIEQVEALLRPDLGDTFLITSRPDPLYGETVVMLTTRPVDETVFRVLPPYWKPRHIITVPSLPFTATGKPDRAEAKRIAKSKTLCKVGL